MESLKEFLNKLKEKVFGGRKEPEAPQPVAEQGYKQTAARANRLENEPMTMTREDYDREFWHNVPSQKPTELPKALKAEGVSR